MYVRIVRGKPLPGLVDLDEVAKRWEETLAPRLRSQPGFRQAYFVGNRETNSVMGIQFWDALPDPSIMSQFRD